MGLDLFEVVLVVEKSFDISLARREGSDISTVGDMCNRILEILSRENQAGAELADSVSERMRQSLESVRGEPQEEISPDKPLRELFPAFGRRRSWKRFGESLGLEIPPLERPPVVDPMLVCLAAVFGWTFAILMSIELFAKESLLSHEWIAIPLITITGAVMIFLLWELPLVLMIPANTITGAVMIFLLWWLGRLLTLPIAVFWPSGFRTLGDLKQWILARHYGRVVKLERRFSPTEVWVLLQRIVADVLHVDIQKVTRVVRVS